MLCSEHPSDTCKIDDPAAPILTDADTPGFVSWNELSSSDSAHGWLVELSNAANSCWLEEECVRLVEVYVLAGLAARGKDQSVQR